MLSQVQVIQSLAEALSWFEKELSWGVAPAELNHLTGRIGELYAAMITRGKMALETNQRGYDVISADNERISVKTVTSSTNVSFKASTFDLVDRIMVLRINNDDERGVSVETLLNCPSSEFLKFTALTLGKYTYNIPANSRPKKPLESLQVIHEAFFGEYKLLQYENGQIFIRAENEIVTVVKPYLR